MTRRTHAHTHAKCIIFLARLLGPFTHLLSPLLSLLLSNPLVIRCNQSSVFMPNEKQLQSVPLSLLIDGNPSGVCLDPEVDVHLAPE